MLSKIKLPKPKLKLNLQHFHFSKILNIIFKDTFISFYKAGNKFYVQKLIKRNEKILFKEDYNLEEEDFLKLIKESFIENTQTYVSTIIDTFNQGIVDSCSHARYNELGINIDNIKILCLDKYSIFIGLYELNEFEKEMSKYRIDYIFSPHLLIDIIKKTDTKNTLYLLITEGFCSILIYENSSTPKYSNIYQFQIDEEGIEEEPKEEEEEEDIDLLDDIEEIEEIDDLDDLEEDIDNTSIDDLEEDEEEKEQQAEDEVVNLKTEIEALDFVKSSIKDYYENYGEDFLQKAVVFYTNDISKGFQHTLEQELLIDISYEQINIADLINQLAMKELDV